MPDVDLKCAVNAKIVFANARRLPIRGVAYCRADERPRDVCGRLRSPATMPAFRRGQKPPNAGNSYPATPPSERQVMAMLDACPNNPAGRRLRALIVILWRSGLRIHEALNLTEHELDRAGGTVTVLKGKGGKYRVVGMDDWAFEQIDAWTLERRMRYPAGPLLCLVQGPTRGKRWAETAARGAIRDLAKTAGVPRRCAPHQLRHALAVEMAREGHPIIYISRQLGHSNVGTTATYLSGISNDEVVKAVMARRPPEAIA